MMPPRKRIGRPPLVGGERSTAVSTRLSSPDYDRACAKASRDRVSVAQIIRRAVTRLLDEDAEDDD
jgi:hypothetical protein